MQSSSVLSLSPSFTNYSSGKLAEIAARVVKEFREESDSEFDDVFGFKGDDKSEDRALEQPGVQEEEHGKNSEDDDFEFPSVFREPASAISADEIFYNGQIRPVFPLFNRDVLFADVETGNGKVDSSKPPAPSSIRLPLRQLFNEDRDPPSCSSSETEDLDGVPAGTYCVWRPKKGATGAEESPGRCKKSNSTGNSKGSSKRWKFRDLLYHSNSDGNDTFVFLSASSDKAKKEDDKAAEKETSTDKNSDQVKVAGKAKPKVVGGGEVVPVTAAHEAQCTRNRVAAKDGEKRRSFLPYRQDLVGLLASKRERVEQKSPPLLTGQ